jgi:cytochrome d ubiquinol oxidase subunit II
LSRGVTGAAQSAPFAGAVAIFVLAFVGLAYGLFPYVVIDRLTFWDAAAHPSSLKVVLIEALLVLPFIVAYTAFAYYVFRGKARAGLYD